jgi:3-mercaptopyruvate sulfurtransferase SseA
MNFSSSLNQIYFYLTISFITSFIVNLSRIDTVPIIADPLEKIEEIEQINEKMSNPIIREISIDIAKDLFDQNMLFVDARSEEYYLEGHIPKAVCNDNLDFLITKMEEHISIDDGFIVYCSDDDCGSSEELAYLLQEQGFSNIFLFKGGWKQWVDNNLPIEGK